MGRDNRVPKRTAYRWANDPNVRSVVDSCRRRTLDRAVGLMVGRASWVCDHIAHLANAAESESVKLRALRTIFSEVIAAAKLSDVELRMGEIENAVPRPGWRREYLGLASTSWVHRKERPVSQRPAWVNECAYYKCLPRPRWPTVRSRHFPSAARYARRGAAV